MPVAALERSDGPRLCWPSTRSEVSVSQALRLSPTPRLRPLRATVQCRQPLPAPLPPAHTACSSSCSSIQAATPLLASTQHQSSASPPSHSSSAVRVIPSICFATPALRLHHASLPAARRAAAAARLLRHRPRRLHPAVFLHSGRRRRPADGAVVHQRALQHHGPDLLLHRQLHSAEHHQRPARERDGRSRPAGSHAVLAPPQSYGATTTC